MAAEHPETKYSVMRLLPYTVDRDHQQQVRGWLQRRIVQPALAASVGVAKVCGIASAVFVVLRQPLRTIAFIYFLASRLALLAGLLILYT